MCILWQGDGLVGRLVCRLWQADSHVVGDVLLFFGSEFGLPLVGRWLALCEQLAGMLWAQCQLFFFWSHFVIPERGGCCAIFIFCVFCCFLHLSVRLVGRHCV